MACPPGNGRGCPHHKNSEICNCCSKPNEVCEYCNRPVIPVNLSGKEVGSAENPQIDYCQCFKSVISSAADSSPEPMDCGDSPRVSPLAQKSSGISLTTPSTSRSTARASPQARQSSGVSLTAPSTSSVARSHTLENARGADKFLTPTGAKTKSKGSGSSKHNSPEMMTSSSDGYPLSSEERYNLRSNKATPRARKEYNRGQVRKKKTSPEKTKEVKSESSPEGFINLKRATNLSTFGNSAENKISNGEKKNTGADSDYTRKSSTQGGHSYNMRTPGDRYYASPESDNTNNDRVCYINVVPPDVTPNWSSQQNESYFTSYKENVPFRQGYRPSLPRPFPRQDQPFPLPIPAERFPPFQSRFSGPYLGMSRYQQPYAGESPGPSVIGLPPGQKLEDEKVEHQQKIERIKEWLLTVEPLSGNESNEHAVPPTLEAAEREQGAVGIASSSQSATDTSCTEIYDVQEFSKMSESEDTDDSKKTRRKK